VSASRSIAQRSAVSSPTSPFTTSSRGRRHKIGTRSSKAHRTCAHPTHSASYARQRSFSDALITKFQALGTSATVNDAADALIRTTQTEFPIVDSAGRLRGVLTRDAMIKALKERGPDTPVLEVMQADIPTVPARSKLETALRSLMAKRPVIGVLTPRIVSSGF